MVPKILKNSAAVRFPFQGDPKKSDLQILIVDGYNAIYKFSP